MFSFHCFYTSGRERICPARRQIRRWQACHASFRRWPSPGERRQDFLLVSAERHSMQFNTDENNPDWRSRIDKHFTSLRGYAALTVMLAHYQYIGFLPGVPVFKYSAQCGLMLFFFLSSFLLCHSLASDPNWTARPHLSLHDLFDKQDIPHISLARRHNRPDILE